jgi:hypothetical protein
MKAKLLLAFLLFQTLPLFAAKTDSLTVKVIKDPVPVAQASPLPVDNGIRTPFANEEAKFYQKAWPIEKSHSLYALILMGSVLAILFTVLIRKMAQSPPRKQKEP